MITLEQIQVLDKKIKDAIELINRLREEKKTLSNKIAAHEETISLLREEISSCKNNSDQIEEGFKEVLSQLDLVDDSEALPGQQEQVQMKNQPQTDEDENSDITDEPDQENMQFEASADESATNSASEEPDIDKGIPLTPDDTVIEEESQVNHSEQQENEDTRSPQDLDIF